MCLKLKIEHQNRVVIKQDLCKFPMYLYLRWRQFLSVFNLLTFHFFPIPSCIFDSLYKMSLRKGISFETLCSQSNYSYLESRDFSRHSQHSVTSDYRHLLWRLVMMTRVFVTNWYLWVNRFCQFCQSNCIAFHHLVLRGGGGNSYMYRIRICWWTLTSLNYCDRKINDIIYL